MKNGVGSPQSENSNENTGGDDLEMVYTATKSDKTVLEDGLKEDSGKRKMMEKIACGIDNVSRVLFPLAFVAYNIFYWTYY